MTVASISEARDIIIGIFTAAWTTGLTDLSLDPTAYPVVFQDKRQGDFPAPYVEVALKHTDGGNVAIGDSGRKRVRAEVTLTLSIYTHPGDGLTVSDTLVKIASEAYESKRSLGGPAQIMVRRTRVVEDGLTGNGYRVRVLVDLCYDRIQGMTT